MDAFALVIFFCLSGDTPVCDATAAAYFPAQKFCEVQSQMAAAEWSMQRPNITIKAITCMSSRDLQAILGRREA